jgi:arginine decarboxylase
MSQLQGGSGMEIENCEWPVLIISGQFDAQNDEGYRLRQLTEQLEEIQDCRVIPSYTYEDGYKIFRSRADFGCIVVDWDIPDEDPAEATTAKELIVKMRKRHQGIPIILLTGRMGMDLIPTEILRDINDCLWKTSETISFMAGRIETHVVDYVRTVYPPFFGAMVQYSNEYKFAWHTPGHMGGEGFRAAPRGWRCSNFSGKVYFDRTFPFPFRN